MLKIAWSPAYILPLPEGHRFPMEKYQLIPDQLLYEGVIEKINLFEPESLPENILLQTHGSEYWRQLKHLTLPASEIRKIGFPLSKALVEREIIIAQGTCDAALYALDYQIAMNVAGGTHHAFSNRGEGFCVLNDIAIAANFLLRKKLVKKILVIDLDVHQGNGTASIFQNVSEVFTFSMHGANNFPARKEISDLDIPLEDQTTDEKYLTILKEIFPRLISSHQPDFIFYLSGADVLETDKLGKLALTKEGCKERDRFVFETCKLQNIPVSVSMGGGYSPKISDIVDAHCNTFKTAMETFF